MVIIIFVLILIIGLYFYTKKNITTIKEESPIDNQLLDQIGGKQTVECLAGTYVTKDGCELCSPGTYSTTKNSTTCNLCPAGKYSPISGSRWCIDCIGAKEGSSTCI